MQLSQPILAAKEEPGMSKSQAHQQIYLSIIVGLLGLIVGLLQNHPNTIAGAIGGREHRWLIGRSVRTSETDFIATQVQPVDTQWALALRVSKREAICGKLRGARLRHRAKMQLS